MLLISYTNISPSLIVIFSTIQEKQQKTYFLMYSNVYDDVINFDVCEF